MTFKQEIQAAADNFNLKMLLERSLLQLVRTDNPMPTFDVTIQPDRYIESKIINVSDEFRRMVEKHFSSYGFEILMWNNTGSTFRVRQAIKDNELKGD